MNSEHRYPLLGAEPKNHKVSYMVGKPTMYDNIYNDIACQKIAAPSLLST